ncbi:MAG: hypothetical protein GY754_08465 [bacterium]|nr:hypothetical protein [bacterium]
MKDAMKRIPEMIFSFLFVLYAISGCIDLIGVGEGNNLQNISTITAGFGETLEGIGETLDDIKNTFTGIKNFFSRIAIVLGEIGLSTFVLFLAVLIFSSGLSAIGLSQGRQSFFVSLLVADLIWIYWKESFNPESLAYFGSIIKSNLMILIPVTVILVLQRGLPALYDTIRRQFKKSKPVLSVKDGREMVEEFQDETLKFQKSFLKDIFDAGDSKKVSLSMDTLKYKENLQEMLQVLEKKINDPDEPDDPGEPQNPGA